MMVAQPPHIAGWASRCSRYLCSVLLKSCVLFDDCSRWHAAVLCSNIDSPARMLLGRWWRV
jgi:hypothetical protein